MGKVLEGMWHKQYKNQNIKRNYKNKIIIWRIQYHYFFVDSNEFCFSNFLDVGLLN
jgi:hypothetical protein